MNPKTISIPDQKAHLLRSVVSIDDHLAPSICPNPGPEYFRAYILEERKTSKIIIFYRYSYPGAKRWYFLSAGAAVSDPEAAAEQCSSLICQEQERVIAIILGDLPSPSPVKCLVPLLEDGIWAAAWEDLKSLERNLIWQRQRGTFS